MANILTIGTEITSGEIVNTNAAWIAKQLEEAGHTVQAHLSVPDERKAIAAALKSLGGSDILIVCGGLGPTSDDVTRETTAKWAGRPLVFSKQVWQALEASYAQRGLPLREAHRHQCYFPKGCKPINNPVGTALGFTFRKKKTLVFVLPGPPRELEAMWASGVAPRLRRGRALPWHHWTLLAVPESEVAEIVEPIISGLGIEAGYRASVPYVYLKLRGRRYSNAIGAAVTAGFKGKVMWPGKTDFVEELVARWSGKEILIQDLVSRGILGARLAKHLVSSPSVQVRIESNWGPSPATRLDGASTCAQLLPVAGDDGAVDIIWRDGKTIQKLRFQMPYGWKVTSERGAKSAAEWALYNWWSWTKA